ncbi:uncharacterized protein LOC124542346 [Vanessa cardui]|uniref:uncharacterized protein LOC124542346 n=1 Tax=Vanessa cardui TaxID=171605 RepID=UPI001F139265|nr:uncharacterized protein LOC124542346 [Vanessa cardui]
MSTDFIVLSTTDTGRRKMLRLLIFAFLLSTIYTHPVKDEDAIIEAEDTKEIVDLKKMLNDVSYVTNFKNMMADYVKSQYKNLTIDDMEKIQDYLEEFCHRFARDLKDIVENYDQDRPIGKVNDGLPDSTFEDIKKCIKNELPNVTDVTADQITYVLRKNIFVTRQKIDAVIRSSEIAAIENA